MRFGTLSQGVLARRALPLPLPGREPVTVDVRPLTTAEEVDAQAQARSIAKAKGVENPREGETLYDLALMACVLLRGVIDHDSPADAPVPFFDSAEQVMSLDRDRVLFLYEGQTGWQERCSPRQTTLTTEQYIGFIMALASAEEDDPGSPFWSLPRSTLASFGAFTARLLAPSLGLRSPPSSGSEPEATGASTPSTSEVAPAPPPTTPTTRQPCRAKVGGKKGRRR